MKKILFSALLLIPVMMGIAQTLPAGLQSGTIAPEFSAKDQNNKWVSLQASLKKGPVVLVFYRGQWCPYCNKQLKQLEDSLSLITNKGAQVFAITPERPENILKTITKTKASYPILYDDGLKIMKQYAVAYEVDKPTIDKYKKYGIDFTEANGSNGASLPVPAVYIINKEGKIIFRHFDPDYRYRASIQEMLAHL
jgi:peroxiredoxin